MSRFVVVVRRMAEVKRNPSQGQFNKEISSKIDIDIVSCPNMICEIHGENRNNVSSSASFFSFGRIL